MCQLSGKRTVGFLLHISILVLTSRTLIAANPRDSKIELMETTYRLDAGNTAEVTLHQRWRALTGQGRAAISQIHIPYGASFQDVEIKSIKTLKKDGFEVKGDPTSAFDTQPSADPLAPFFSDIKLRTIIPPNVETGDAVEYEAVIHIRKWPKPGDFWFSHYLTTNVPVLSETVVLDLPADRGVALYESSTNPGKTVIANGRRVERWLSANPAAANANIEGVPPLFAVSSILSWDAFGQWIRSLNKSAAEPTPEIAALAANLTANKSSEQERITALYTYVATKVRYISVSFGLGRLQPHTAPVVLHNAYGDCKDQTALLSALLAAAGFRAHPVITTPMLGVRVPDVPTPDQFIHEFIAVETRSGLVFLDTSMGPVPPQVLAPGVRGRSALLIGDPTSSVIDIPMESPVPAGLAARLTGKVTAAGGFEGSSRFEFQGRMELGWRRVFLDATEAEKETILRQLAGPEFQNANVRQVSSGDPGDLTKPFWVQCQLSEKDFFSPEKTSMRIALELSASQIIPVEAKKPDKPLPVESLSATRSMDLIIDPSLTIENGMPVHLKTAFGAFDSEFSYQSGHLKLARSFELNGTAIAPSDWDAFVDFMRSAQAAIDRGFTLERHTSSAVSAGPSPLSRSLQGGIAAYQRHDYEGAKRAFLEATKLDPQNRSAWNDLGQTYFALQEYDEAERAYKRQIEVNPKDPWAYNNLGLVYRALKREDDAMVWFRKQIAVDPRGHYAHNNLSISLAAKKQWEQAREEAAIAAEITPEDATRWSRLGIAQIKTGQASEAVKSFERALAQVHNAMLENDIAYVMADAGIELEKAWQLVAGTLNPEARLVCQPETLSRDDKCSSQLRRVANMLDTAGWVLYRQGKLREAEPYIWSSYAITPRTVIELHLSVMLAKSGRFDESLKCFARASSRPDFSRVDAGEARRELAKAAGGETELDARLKEIQTPVVSPGSTARVIALVDEHGKVLEAQSIDPQTSDFLIGEAKSLTLLPVSWPEHSIRSIRTIEFRRDGAKWSLDQSYVGLPSEPSASVKK